MSSGERGGIFLPRTTRTGEEIVGIDCCVYILFNSLKI